MQPNNPNQPPYPNNGQPPAYNPQQPPQGYNPNQPPGGYPPNYNPNYPPPQPYYGQGGPQGGAPRKKGMPGCVVALLVVVAVVVVLGVVGVATGVVTGSFSFSTGPMQITDATMAKGFANNEAVNPTSTFSPTDNPFYCVVKVQNTTAGATLKGVWTAVDAGGAQNQQIASKTLTLEAGKNYTAHFDLSLTNNLPTGSYKFEIYLNDTLTKTLNFTVQ
ncbi:MAG: hypothetical protein J0I20_26320 [Chloroflexi bacterium]|nr:hypothetical protein [Chloroflexota bacterium]OJV91877.1 MAG: hypothetical protein BGO39_14205 [Chloroflexi bacterium 54-19]